MKIVDIFADQRLFSFQYEGEKENEFDKVMEFWTDVNLVREYGKVNGITDKSKLNQFVNAINYNAEYLEDWLDDIKNGKDALDEFFEPLDSKEKRKEEKLYRAECVITKQKAKRYVLRIYALRIDLDTYIITGGAIKWSEKMDGHDDTKKELIKFEEAIIYLDDNGVFDKDSLIDLKNEEEY